jgi:hypothetical protein
VPPEENFSGFSSGGTILFSYDEKVGYRKSPYF